MFFLFINRNEQPYCDIAILRYCDIAITSYTIHLTFHPSLPPSKIFAIPFAISQRYRNHLGQVHRPERVNQCTCPHGPKLNIAPCALAYSSNILNCRKDICTIMLHTPSSGSVLKCFLI